MEVGNPCARDNTGCVRGYSKGRLRWGGAVFAVLAAAVVSTHAPRAHPAAEQELVVYAAASLHEAFQSLAARFEADHPGVRVRTSFAGSQDLRVQIEHGAKPDVFASADERHMRALQREGLLRGPVLFAHNLPVLVVPAGNVPATITRFVDLPKAKHIVVGAPEVPVGAYTEAVLAAADRLYGHGFRARVQAHVCSRELSVRQVLAKVVLGEADAGIVYRTDALSAKQRVVAIPIPATIHVRADYPIAALRDAPHPDLARAWLRLVLSREGQGVLAAAGFAPARGEPMSEASP